MREIRPHGALCLTFRVQRAMIHQPQPCDLLHHEAYFEDAMTRTRREFLSSAAILGVGGIVGLPNQKMMVERPEL
jgi:hypothetical protein